jgi:hypothetical protein
MINITWVAIAQKKFEQEEEQKHTLMATTKEAGIMSHSWRPTPDTLAADSVNTDADRRH